MQEWKELILSFMKKHRRRYIKTIEIEQHLEERLGKEYEIHEGYFSFAKTIEELIKEGVITPIWARGDNHQNPPVYNEHKLVHQEVRNNPTHLKRLMIAYPFFQMGAFKDEEVFQEWKFYLDRMHGFVNKKEMHNGLVLKANERSYDLFGDEKFLLSKEGVKLLSLIGITLEDLYCRKTHEPFIEKHVTAKPKHILIIENKDTYNSIKELLMSGTRTWFGVTMDMVIYGEGDKIHRSYAFLEEYDLDSDYQVYYFGDLDARGIWICTEVMKLDERVQPFVPFYQELLFRYGDSPSTRPFERKLSDRLIHSSFNTFASFFPSHDHDRLQHCVRIDGSVQYYVPQEGLNIDVLFELGGRNECLG
jgi:phage pi2 protein 07